MAKPEPSNQTSILSAIKSVLAAFFGVQNAANHQRDAQSGRPVLFIVVAVVMTLLLVVAVWLGVKAFLAMNSPDSKTANTPNSETPYTQPANEAKEFLTPPGLDNITTADTIEHRVAPCLSCHKDADLNTAGGYIPRIAGKPAGYIYNQLQHFRSGRRRNVVMTEMVSHLSDDYLWEMSEYFAQRKADYPAPLPVTNAEKFARGEQLALQGDGEIPSCGSCHGDNLVGVLPSVPGLLGLPADYTMAQFSAWQTGSRQAAEPDCMGHIANQLSINDQQAVAEWLASRPLPPNVKPQVGVTPKAVTDLCGSVALPSADAPQTKQELSQGAYLTKLGNCAGCHTADDGADMAGGREIESPYGTFITPNITPAGIGDWSSDDFYNALHHGKRPDGSSLYPACPFPSFTHISRADSDLIFDDLQSLPAVKTEPAEHQLGFPYKHRGLLKPWRAVKFEASQYQNNEAKSVEWNRGAYLVKGLGHCAECHNERGRLGKIKTDEEQSGALVNGWHAGSLNGVAGVQSWSEQETARWLQTGRNQHAAASGPMAQVIHNSLQYLSDSDALAMARYLRDLPKFTAEPIAKLLRVPTAAGSRQYVSGKGIYAEQCASCHGATGEGSAVALALAGNRVVTAEAPINLIQSLMHGGYGPGTQGNPRPFGMPPYQQQLSNEQAASVLTYIRNEWGNSATAIAPEDVERFYHQ